MRLLATAHVLELLREFLQSRDVAVILEFEDNAVALGSISEVNFGSQLEACRSDGQVADRLVRLFATAHVLELLREIPQARDALAHLEDNSMALGILAKDHKVTRLDLDVRHFDQFGRKRTHTRRADEDRDGG